MPAHAGAAGQQIEGAPLGDDGVVVQHAGPRIGLPAAPQDRAVRAAVRHHAQAGFVGGAIACAAAGLEQDVALPAVAEPRAEDVLAPLPDHMAVGRIQRVDDRCVFHVEAPAAQECQFGFGYAVDAEDLARRHRDGVVAEGVAGPARPSDIAAVTVHDDQLATARRIVGVDAHAGDVLEGEGGVVGLRADREVGVEGEVAAARARVVAFDGEDVLAFPQELRRAGDLEGVVAAGLVTGDAVGVRAAPLHNAGARYLLAVQVGDEGVVIADYEAEAADQGGVGHVERPAGVDDGVGVLHVRQDGLVVAVPEAESRLAELPSRGLELGGCPCPFRVGAGQVLPLGVRLYRGDHAEGDVRLGGPQRDADGRGGRNKRVVPDGDRAPMRRPATVRRRQRELLERPARRWVEHQAAQGRHDVDAVRHGHVVAAYLAGARLMMRLVVVPADTGQFALPEEPAGVDVDRAHHVCALYEEAPADNLRGRAVAVAGQDRVVGRPAEPEQTQGRPDPPVR